MSSSNEIDVITQSIVASVRAVASPWLGVPTVAGGALASALALGSDASESKTPAELNAEAAKAETQAAVTSAFAKAQQELAIAARIAMADEVEIEEFYDASGEGSFGLKGAEAGFTLGASGAGRKITRRIVRFKGWREGTEALLQGMAGAAQPKLDEVKEPGDKPQTA